jgi:hypothetical protein
MPPQPKPAAAPAAALTYDARAKALGPGHPEALLAAEADARALEERGQASAAEELLRRALRGVGFGRGPIQAGAAPLVRVLAEIVEQQGRNIDADALWRDLVRACDASLGALHAETRAARVGLSELLQRTGRSLAALEILRPTLHPPADDATGRAARLAHGRALTELERFSEAEEVQRALMAELLGRTEEADALRVREELATTLKLLGRPLEGVEGVEALADERERLLGPEDERTLEARVAALALRVTDAPETVAEDVLPELAARCEAVLGVGHRLTVLARVHQGRLSEARGAAREGREQLLATLTDLEAALGPSAPAVLLLRSDVGALLAQTEAAEEAEALLSRNIALRRAIEGRDHVSVLADEAQRARALVKLERLREAEAIAASVLKARDRRAGPDHAETLEALDLLASIHERLRRPAAALPLRERALLAQTRLTGPSHPLTLDRQLALAWSLVNSDHPERARPHVLGALEGHRRRGALGESDLAANLHSAAEIFLIRLRDRVTAEHLLEEAVALLTRLYGADDPRTLDAAKTLSGVSATTGSLVELIVPLDGAPAWGHPLPPR